MAFNILTIRTGDHDDGSLYPVLGAERDEVEFEPLDGRSVTKLFAEAAYIYRIVGNGIHEEAHVSDIRMAVYITDARVAVACSKYDKGGGWRGSLIAVPLNAVSMARAAYRRQGPCPLSVVGQRGVHREVRVGVLQLPAVAGHRTDRWQRSQHDAGTSVPQGHGHRKPRPRHQPARGRLSPRS